MQTRMICHVAAMGPARSMTALIWVTACCRNFRIFDVIEGRLSDSHLKFPFV
jgi:hypothetical protein